MKGKIYFPQAGKEKLSKQTNKNTTKTDENRKSRKVSPLFLLHFSSCGAALFFPEFLPRTWDFVPFFS